MVKRLLFMRLLIAMAATFTFSIAAKDVVAQDEFDPPAWAYPVMDEGRGRGPDDGAMLSVPGSDLQLTQTQINDPFSPPDWYPDEHPPMPEIVSHGRPPDVRACGQCHMLHGMGHPESAALAGLPVNYVVRQMLDFRSGARTSLVKRRDNVMIQSATHASEEEILAAAEYYAQIKPIKWVTVVEADMVPETYVGAGNMRHAEPDGGMEPIGQRIIEIPEDSHGAERRDPHSPFIAYVPPGSIATGEALSTTGGGKTIQCALCHGPDLKGLAEVPGIAGRSPVYLARQMWDIKHGARTGTSAALMLAIVANLTYEDVIALSAYASSLEP